MFDRFTLSRHLPRALGFAALAIGAAIQVGPLSAQTIQTAQVLPAGCEPGKVAQHYPSYAGKVARIAASPTSPPFTYADPANLDRVIGLEAEAIEFALNCAGIKFEYVKGPFSALLPTLFSGATDVMVANVFYRPDRAEKADFVLIVRIGQSVIVPLGNPKAVRQASDLCGLSASTTVGGGSAAVIEKQSQTCVASGKPPIQYQPSVDQDAAIRQLSNGRIDFVMDGAVTAAARAANSEGGKLEVVLTLQTDVTAGPAVRKGNDDMLQAVYRGLKMLEANGGFKELFIKYKLAPDLMIPVQIAR